MLRSRALSDREVDSHLRIFNLFIGCIPAVSNDNNGVGLLFSSKGIGIAWIIFPTGVLAARGWVLPTGE